VPSIRLTVNVDAIGIGYNFALHLRDQGESAHDSERFANLKAEYYWGLRERVPGGPDQGVRRRAHHRAAGRDPLPAHLRGQVVIESKDEMRRRGVKSPDRADSVMLAFAAEQSDPRSPLGRTPGASENGGGTWPWPRRRATRPRRGSMMAKR
jgi:hypothetical protein